MSRAPLFLALLVARATAQTGRPTDPLPPLPPQVWREIGRDEEVIEERCDFSTALPSGQERNDRVPLRVFRPVAATGPVPIVLILHYWGASDQKGEVSLARDLARRGIAGALIALPYHLDRAPLGTRSGQLAITTDPERLKATVLQGTADCRRAIDALTGRSEIDGARVGIVGLSLGALVASLATAVDPRITRAAFLLGGVDFAHIVWTSSLVTAQRDAMRRQGLSETKLRALLADIEPANYLRPRPGLVSFVVGGRYDTVVPPESTDLLANLLGDPARLTIETGHYGGIFVQRKLLRQVASFLDTSFAGKVWTAPKALYAPTLRLGVKFDYPTGLDVGAGIDLIKFDRRGDLFATAYLTPRGLQVFVGQRVWRQMHIGFTIAPRGVAVGALWSVVL